MGTRVRSKSVLVLAAVGAATFGLAACSSSSKSTSAPTSAPAGSSGASGSSSPAATGTTLYIGSIESQTGAAQAGGAKQTPATDILNAWVKMVNATGGIDGHPVKITVLNDNADPAQAKADLTQLIQQDNVLAIVGEDASTTEPGWNTYINAHPTPVIGGAAYSLNWFTNPNWYPATTTVVSNVWAEVYAAKQAVANPKIGSLLCNNATVCEGAVALQKAAAQQLNVPIVYNQTVSATAVDYTPQCLAMKAAGANVIEPQGINDVTLARDCHRQNYSPIIITENYDTTPAQIQQNPSELAGMEGPAPAFPPFEQFPQTAGYFNLLKQYAPQYLPGGSKYANVIYLQAATDAYVAAQVFELAVKNANVAASQPVTKADIVQGLSMIQNNTIGGISPPLSYGNGKTPSKQVLCFYLYKTVNSSIGYETIPPSSLQTDCQPATSG